MREKWKLWTFFGGIIFLTVFFFWTTPNISPPPSIKIWDENKVLLYESSANSSSNLQVKFEEIPSNFITAVVLSEDASFWTNPGYDLAAIIRSAWLNFRAGKIVSGASTITQQLARQNLPDKNPIIRKVREISTAIRLTTTHSKKDILTKYLNSVYFGHNLYGIGAAALNYFGKPPTNLSLGESVYLAGILSNPENPTDNREQLLSKMLLAHKITKEESELAKNEKVEIKFSEPVIKAPHFVDFVLNQYQNMNLNVDNSGVNIYTTLSYPDYTRAKEIARLWVENLSQKHDLSNAALVLIENNSGAIKVMLGGIDYFDGNKSGQVNLTTALRQPGSALKPITYAAAFMGKTTPATIINDHQKVYPTKSGEGFAPNNYDNKFHGPVTARVALASSLNMPAVEVLSWIELESFLEICQKMGLSTLKPNPKFDLAVTLGGGEVSLLELTNAYSIFARQGKYLPSFSIKKITSDEGKTLYENKLPNGQEVFGENSELIASQITSILSDRDARVMGFGERNPLVLSFPAAAKTGTTTNWHDNWTIGYTPSYTLGVWVGNNDNHPMINLTGITGAAPIWNHFFSEFYKSRPKEEFVMSKKLIPKVICQTNGQLASNTCPQQITEYFIPGTLPEPNGQNPNTVLQITFPQNKAVFQSAPLMVTNEAITFKGNFPESTLKVVWFLNNRQIAEKYASPFTHNWPLILGDFELVAKIWLDNNTQQQTSPVYFSVIEKN